MIRITNFRAELKDRGIHIFASNGKLVLEGRMTNLSPEEKAWFKANKALVLAMLRMTGAPVKRWISHDGGSEAFANHDLDPAYWRLAEAEDAS